MTALFALVRKDIILFLADRRALLFAFVMPIVLGAFMGSVFGGSGKADKARIDIAVVMEDQSRIGQKIVDKIRADEGLNVKLLPLAEAKEQVKKGKLAVAVQVPAGFGEAAGAALFNAANKPALPIYYDPSQNAVLGMVKGILTQHVMQTVSGEMFSGDAGQKMVDTSIAQLESQAVKSAENAELHDFLTSLKKYQAYSKTSTAAESSQPKAGGLSMPFETHEEEMSGEVKFNGYGHAFAGMGVQFILMMSIDFGVGILLARRLGLWNRLLAAPISVNTILGARLLSGALISFGVFCAIFLVAALGFGVRISNLPGFLGIGASFALMTAAFGLLIAAFGKTPEGARGIAVFATLIMVMLGGAWIPSFMFPAWVQSVTKVVPTRWAIDGISDMSWRGLPLEAALQGMGVLLGFALAFMLLAFWKFSRDGRSSVR